MASPQSIQTPHKHLSEIRPLTGVRGVAALYVVIFHFFQPIPLRGPALTLLGHGYLAVDLFFALSGFVMALNYSGMFRDRPSLKTFYIFLARRVARIYPLYLVTLIAATALAAKGWLEFRGGSLWIAFVLNLFMVHSWGPWSTINPPSWSISTEWFAYLVFPLLLPRLLFRNARVAWLAGAVCLLAVASLSVYAQAYTDSPKLLDYTVGPYSLIRCIAEFSLGILLYRATFTPAGAAMREKPWVTYLSTAAILGLMMFRYTDFPIMCAFLFLILGLSGRATLVSRFLGSRIVEYIGQLSYSIYLLHYLMGAVIGAVHAYAYNRRLPHAQVYGVAVTFPLLLVLSAITYTTIEAPGRKLLRKLLEGGQKA